MLKTQNVQKNNILISCCGKWLGNFKFLDIRDWNFYLEKLATHQMTSCIWFDISEFQTFGKVYFNSWKFRKLYVVRSRLFWLFKVSEFEQWKFTKIYSNQRRIQKQILLVVKDGIIARIKKGFSKLLLLLLFLNPWDSTMCSQQFDSILCFSWVRNFENGKKDPSIDDVINRFMILFIFQFKLKKDPTSVLISCGCCNAKVLPVKCNSGIVKKGFILSNFQFSLCRDATLILSFTD